MGAGGGLGLVLGTLAARVKPDPTCECLPLGRTRQLQLLIWEGARTHSQCGACLLVYPEAGGPTDSREPFSLLLAHTRKGNTPQRLTQYQIWKQPLGSLLLLPARGLSEEIKPQRRSRAQCHPSIHGRLRFKLMTFNLPSTAL